jgi:hypothetical protein
MLNYANRVYRTIRNRNVLDFASEVYVVHHVMKNRNLDHESYKCVASSRRLRASLTAASRRKVQNDIDYVVRLGQRTWGLCKQGWTVLDTQRRVIALLNLPNFMHELTLPRVVPPAFERLVIRRALFRYEASLAPALNFQVRRRAPPLTRTASASHLWLLAGRRREDAALCSRARQDVCHRRAEPLGQVDAGEDSLQTLLACARRPRRAAQRRAVRRRAPHAAARDAELRGAAALHLPGHH